MFYLTTHSTHFIYGYMASDIWLRTILIVRNETRCRHIGYSYRLAARVLLYAPSHRQDNTYHGLCYTSRGENTMKAGRKCFSLTMHSTHFIHGYMASDIWLSTILIVRKETCCHHIGYSFCVWLTVRVLLYAPSNRQDNTYHGLCYTFVEHWLEREIAQWVEYNDYTHSYTNGSKDPDTNKVELKNSNKPNNILFGRLPN